MMSSVLLKSKIFSNLSKSIKVIDRGSLILEIFSQHAKTKEAKTQVELAQLEYMLPRLTRAWTHLERQMGELVQEQELVKHKLKLTEDWLEQEYQILKRS